MQPNYPHCNKKHNIFIRILTTTITQTHLRLGQVDALRHVGDLHRAVREDYLQQVRLQHLVVEKVQVVRNQIVAL